MKLRLLLASLVVPFVAVSLAGPSGAEPSGAVTFPDLTRLNPEVTDYVIEVHDPSPELGELRLVAPGSGETTLPAQGAVTVDLADARGPGVIVVKRCSEPSGCREIERSEPFTIWRDLLLFDLDHAALGRAGDVPLRLLGYQFPRNEVVDVDWKLVDVASGTTVAAGSGARGEDELAPFRVVATIPDDLVQYASYRFEVGVGVDSSDLGTLAGRVLDDEFLFDNDGNDDVRFKKVDGFYPAQDGYRDQLFAGASMSRGLRKASLDVEDSRGRRVARLDDATTIVSQLRGTWDGRSKGKIVDAGTYYLRVRGEDRAGNKADVRQPFEVFDERLRWKTWSSSVSPRKSALDSVVGRCSSLKKLRGGGLGLYSQTSCRKPGQSVVATVHGAYLPAAFEGSYRDVRVDVRGGAARGADDAYLVLGYLDRQGRFSNRTQLDGSRGLHRGDTISDKDLIRDRTTERPYIVWQTGLSEGSRYDVQGFRMQVRYRSLE